MADLHLTLTDINNVVSGTLVGGDDRLEVGQVVIDSREPCPLALYVALRGERFDGHDFVEGAVRSGAVAAMVERALPDLPIPQIVVGDCLCALQSLGRERRRAFDGTVVAITGSSGKTSTRRLLTSILKQRFDTLQPIRNFNNHVGVPLTLLRLEQRHRAAVLELGCSDFGEIRTLTQIVDPDLALITNVGPAHLERLGSLAGVARAKGELFSEIKTGAIAVINSDDERVLGLPVRASKKVFYGTGQDVDIRLEDRKAEGARGQTLTLSNCGRRLEIFLPLVGEHNAKNALAAAAAAVALGTDEGQIARGISQVRPESGRLELHPGGNGALIIDDSYNANPASSRAALDALAEVVPDGRKVAVLGDMLELGAASVSAHLELGRLAAQAGLALLVTLGEGARDIERGAAESGLPKENRVHAIDHESAAASVLKFIGDGDAVLVKGSRSMRMENVVARLLGEEH